MVDRSTGSSEFEIGIVADQELEEALNNVIELAGQFKDKFDTFKSYFGTTGDTTHLWEGQDAEAFRNVVTRDKGIIDRLNNYSTQVANMGDLAKEIRRVITDAKNQLTTNINAIDGGGA